MKERKAFGNPLSELQNTRFTMAECMTDTNVGRVFVDSCIQRFLAGQLDTVTAAMAKDWLHRRGRQGHRRMPAAAWRLRLHDEVPDRREYADTRVQRIYGGTNEIMKEVIARSMGLGK